MMPQFRPQAGFLWSVRTIHRHALPFGIGAVCLWFLADRLGADGLQGFGPALSMIAPHQWALALCATAISFWALGCYDIVIHRHFRTPVPAWQAGISGAAAIALAQVLGFGVFTGALVRWRLLPDLDPGAAFRISLGVAVSFLAGLALCLIAFGLVLRPAVLPAGLIWAGALAALTALVLLVRHPVITFARWQVRAPSLPAIARIIGLTAIDTGAAALALYLLLPVGSGIGFAALLPAYLLALGAALLSGTPGGVGPFELVLLTALPQVPEPSLLAAILAFRVVYYAIPAGLAVVRLRRPLRVSNPPDNLLKRPTPVQLRQGPRAELGVCRQNHARLLTAGPAQLAVVETAQTAVALFDPVRGDITAALPALRRHARQRNLLPCLYKTSPRPAARARAVGWHALHIADEAVIDPATFDLAHPACRQLRRKLRQADRAGVTITSPEPLPFADLARIDADWQARTGPARGLSMGRFCPDHLHAQKVLVAWVQGRAVGFASFHICDHEICLDLMRFSDDAPTGTMHALVAQAIEFAREKGCPRVSLAALPPAGSHAIARLIARALGSGLSRFKLAFAPRRQPLYVLSPTRTGLALALADIALSIRAPDRTRLHNDVEEITFAPAHQT